MQLTVEMESVSSCSIYFTSLSEDLEAGFMNVKKGLPTDEQHFKCIMCWIGDRSSRLISSTILRGPLDFSGSLTLCVVSHVL